MFKGPPLRKLTYFHQRSASSHIFLKMQINLLSDWLVGWLVGRQEDRQIQINLLSLKDDRQTDRQALNRK